MSRRVIGIDLGTLNSCVAAVKEGRAEVLRGDNHGTVPSCVAFTGDKVLVGAPAKRHAVTEPRSTLIAVKRLIGHAFDSKEVREAAKRVPYEIKRSRLGSVLLQVGDNELSPVQVSTLILKRIKEIAEKALGEPVSSAVISVPAHFNDVQRKATMLAGQDAGLEVLRLINEPTAAAFAYGYKKEQDFTLAVYDLGGGTFDVTILRAQGDKFTVVATDGDSFLGGEDFDFAIADWLEQEFATQHGQDLSGDPAARLRLKEASEKAKIELSEVETTQIDLPFLTKIADGTRPNFSRQITREKISSLVAPLVQRTRELCERCLATANISVEDIHEVLLVGGQSRMPIVRDQVRKIFAREPRRDINPDEVVAMGAALFAYSLVADELKEEAEADAEEAFAVAIKETTVARKLVKEMADLGSANLDNQALASRLEQLLKAAEGGMTGDEEADATEPSLAPLEAKHAAEPMPTAKTGHTSTSPTLQPPSLDEPEPKHKQDDLPAVKLGVLERPVEKVAAKIEPPAAKVAPPQDDLPAFKFEEPKPQPSKPAAKVAPPQDDLPAFKFEEPKPQPSKPVAKVAPPQDDLPAFKFEEPKPQPSEPVAKVAPPQDDLPAFKFEEPKPQPSKPVAKVEPPQDDLPAFKFEEPKPQPSKPVAKVASPQDDLPAFKFEEPKPQPSKPVAKVAPPQDDLPAFKFEEPKPQPSKPVAKVAPPQDDLPAFKFEEPKPQPSKPVAKVAPPQDDLPAFKFEEPKPQPSKPVAKVAPPQDDLPAFKFEEPDEEETAPSIDLSGSEIPEVPDLDDAGEFDFSSDQPEERGPAPDEDAASALRYGAVDFSAEPDDLRAAEAPAPSPLEFGDLELPGADEDLDLGAPGEQPAALDFGDVSLPEEDADDSDLSLIPETPLPLEFGASQPLTDPQAQMLGESELPAPRDLAPAAKTANRIDFSDEAIDQLDLGEDEVSGYDTDMDLPAKERSFDADLPTTLNSASVERLNQDIRSLGDNAMEVIRKLEASGAAENLPELMAQAKAWLASTVEGAQGHTQQAAERLHEAHEHAVARKVELLDVTSLPIGIASAANIFSVLIEQNVTIPTKHQRVFTTNQDGQSEVEIRVFQGRGKRVTENQHLGSFILQGIPPARRMEPRIEVTFKIDENGILSVRARDQGSGVNQEIRVEDPVGLMADPSRDPAEKL